MASIRKRNWKSGGETKTAWVADYFDQAGKRHIKTFKQKKEADVWLVAARREVQQGVHTPANSSITVARAGEAWMAQAETDGLERSTLAQYRQHLDHHIKEFLGGIKLGDLTPAGVRAFRNNLIRGTLASDGEKVVGSLGSILANAMADHKVARNVVREQAEYSRRRDRRLERRHARHLEVGVDIPTKDEIRAMLTHAEGRWRPLFLTAIFTGLRASELRGLRWDDVDLDKAELTVRQRADRYGAIGSPKSDAGKRTVPLAPIAVNALREWRLACPKSELSLVFPTSRGKPQAINTIHTRGLVPLQKVAGVMAADGDAGKPKYGMHSLRHAAASLFIEEGFSPKRVQALMGHSTIQMTFDTYGHLFPAPADDQAAMRRLEARLIG